MEGLGFYYFLMILGIFASACSQLLLKKSADQEHRNFILSMLNWRVIFAYSILMGSMVVNIFAMSKGVHLKDLPILEALGYIFVPILSFLVLKERATKRTIISMVIILVGIYIFFQ